jgi:hypothetical protein
MMSVGCGAVSSTISRMMWRGVPLGVALLHRHAVEQVHHFASRPAVGVVKRASFM